MNINNFDKTPSGSVINEVTLSKPSPYQIMIALEFYVDLSKSKAFCCKVPPLKDPNAMKMYSFAGYLSNLKILLFGGANFIEYVDFMKFIQNQTDRLKGSITSNPWHPFQKNRNLFDTEAFYNYVADIWKLKTDKQRKLDIHLQELKIQDKDHRDCKVKNDIYFVIIILLIISV